MKRSAAMAQLPGGPGPAQWPELAACGACAGITLWALLWCAAALVFCRAAGGAIQQSLPWAGLLLLGLGVALAQALVRLLWSLPGRLAWPPEWLLPVPAAALLSILSLKPLLDSGVWVLALLWPPLLLVEAWAVWQRRRVARTPGFDNSVAASAARIVPTPLRSGVRHSRPSRSAASSTSAAALLGGPQSVPAQAAHWSQRLQRFSAAPGQEQVVGQVRLVAASGQRTLTAHVAFCPPLPVVPQITVRQTSGPPARVKLGLTLCHGARFDVRLNSPAAAEKTLVLAFAAVADVSPAADVSAPVAAASDS